MNFSLNDIIKAASGNMPQGGSSVVCDGISIDSRQSTAGKLFVAIEGAHFDGHSFLKDVAQNGAKACLVKTGTKIDSEIPFLEVSDTTKALGDIAGWWRSHFSAPCIAITGSNGKSTTKEMVWAVIGGMGKVLKTEGNFNNLIGLPLTIFKWNESHRAAILEMGMNASGEIRRLTEISNPDVALITNVTAAHLEKLHTVESVAKAKGELFEAMGDSGTIIVNAEDPFVIKMAELYRGKKITFGMNNESDVRFLNMETNGLDSMDISIFIQGKEYTIHLPVPGTHNVMNALAAMSVAVALELNIEDAAKRLSSFTPMSMRFEQIQLSNGVRLVNDSYNANPESMRAAFRTVGAAKRAGRFIAVLGDMLELGAASSDLHEALGGDATNLGVESIYVVGEHSNCIAKGAKRAGMDASAIHECEDVDEIESKIQDELKAGDVILIKGSRGMKMERVAEGLKHSIGTG